MTKAFLSHSSKDKKHFVNEVAHTLGKRNVIYDRFSFEEGEETLSEILKYLDKTDLFVFFISNNSLDSDWVKREILETKLRLDSGQISKFYPIIIDEKITYEDNRIPDWIKDNYNLQPILSKKIVASRIKYKLIEIGYTKHPKLKQIQSLFVGRNAETAVLEERLNNFSKSMPTVLMVSGFTHLGRKTFIYRCLDKLGLIDEPLLPDSIVMSKDMSIEDFIYSLNDFGMLDNDEDLKNLIDKSLEEKILIVHKYMSAAVKYKKTIFIGDEGNLVNSNREIIGWFKELVEHFKEVEQPLFCIATKYQPHHKYNFKDKFYTTNIRELSFIERQGLFRRLLKIYDIEINDKDFNDITNVLTGYPDQIRYATEILAYDKTRNIGNTVVEVTDYNSNRVATLLKSYQNNNEVLKLLRLLAQFEIVTKEYIQRVVEDEDVINIINELYYENIVDFVGVEDSLIKLSDIVRDYIKRNRLEIDEKFKSNIERIIKSDILSDNYSEMDSTTLVFTLKEALKSEDLANNINPEYLIPSHYIRCMKDIYYSKGDLSRVVELADMILQRSSVLLPEVIHDIRYYLCLALAKQKDKRLLAEVQNINGSEHTFLLGFYYRHLGYYSKALEKFNSLVSSTNKPDTYKKSDDYRSHQRANREIVQVLVQMEEHDKALVLAKQNYENNPNNQFHLQSYINCLLNSENYMEHKIELEKKIILLKSIDSPQSKEMAETARALFTVKIEGNTKLAFEIIEECINSFPKNYYPILCKADIATIDKNKTKLEEAIIALEEKFSGFQYSKRTLEKYRSFKFALEGNYDKGISNYSSYLDKYTTESEERFKRRLKKLAEENNC